MARFRKGLHPVNSVKNVINSQGALVAATPSTTDLVIGVRTLATSINPVQVPVGAVVNGIYLSVYILGESGASSGVVNWFIWKNPSNGLTPPDPTNTGVSDQRRFILHEEKGIFATQDGTPMVFKGVIRIPPRMRRIGDQDRIQVVIQTENDTAEFCIQAIYKWFT